MQTCSTRNRNKHMVNELFQDRSKSAASLLYLQKATHVASPNVIPARPVEEHVGTSRPIPAPPSTNILAQHFVALVQVAGETISVTTEMFSLMEAILGQSQRQASAPQENAHHHGQPEA